jgi:protein-L-isoaspartate(D-aspartate) O-methyltransferase
VGASSASEAPGLSTDLERVRRDYARKIEKLAKLRTPGLARGFASVPREDFVGPGPWQVLRPPIEQGYVETPDDDPVHVYETVLIALDAKRQLNNGEPVSLAQWLDLLELTPGNAFAHIGCGVGYYTAIANETVHPGGRSLALEAEPELARRAARNLAPYEDVEVREATGFEPNDGPFDAIFVNAGATQVAGSWLDRLADGGRLLLPLTVSIAGGEIGAGRVIRVVRRGHAFEARFVSFAAIFHCIGARSDEGDLALRDAYREGDADEVRSLRRDIHDRSAACWLHFGDACISYAETPS